MIIVTQGEEAQVIILGDIFNLVHFVMKNIGLIADY